ncbi:hypothetical protein LTR09_012887 [Extremus antarcticus]|uniref:Uncharacterized protein n=1 Tax=Extremus antarcticus TaxID=702011 RepID=A0AAJ0D4E5_9PEZI|nr:hypothetical protein LTR09_012887 [Extremus antarcticus]
MLLLLLLSLFHPATSIPVSAVAATSDCPSKTFDMPWTITNFALTPSSIRFNFIDRNDQLQLKTTCYGTFIDANVGGSISQIENGEYIQCMDEDVAFQMRKGGVLMIERAYEDSCLGPPPYNRGIAFGRYNVVSTLPSCAAGGPIEHDHIFVTITAMAS